MKTTIEGKTFVLTGALSQPRRDTELAIVAAGGKVAKSPTKTTDFMVLGDRPGSKAQKGRMLGIPELSEAELLALLAGEEVEIVEEVIEEVALGDAIGELRALFDGSPTPEVWEEVTQLLDACPPEALSVAVHYVASHTARWPEPPDPFDIIDSIHAYQPTLRGVLRQAPESWLGELLRGEGSEKFALVRGINVGEVQANNTMLMKLLGCEHLSNLRALELGRRSKPGKTFYKALSQAEHLQQLELLGLWGVDHKGWAGISSDATLTSLRALVIHDQYRASDEATQRDAVARLCASGMLQNVETIVADAALLQRFGLHIEQLPRLRVIATPISGALQLFETSPIMDHIERLIVTGWWSNEWVACFEALRRRGVQLDVLDMTSLSELLDWLLYRINNEGYAETMWGLITAALRFEGAREIWVPEQLIHGSDEINALLSLPHIKRVRLDPLTGQRVIL